MLRKNRRMFIALSLVLFFFWQPFALGKTVKVMDNGLNMVRATVELPKGWKMDTDIVSNAMTGLFVRFKYDIVGPNGEILRELPPITYGIITGKSFQQTWQSIIDLAIRDFMTVESVGRLVQSGPLARRTLKELKVKPEQIAAVAQNIYEVTVTGKKNNQPYTASLVFANQSFGDSGGMLTAGIVGSPAKRFDAAIETSFKISRQTKMNPEYDARRSRLIDQETRASTSRHKQRMRNNQQQFNQHQTMMRGRSQMFDQQNQQWRDNFNRSTPGSNSQGYSSHDAYIDSLNETSTFADPDTGQNRTLDGQHQYNYTDGLGGYYGTDDPSFNPGTMPNGDWQEIQPMQPQY